jgi:hypothetical protein
MGCKIGVSLISERVDGDIGDDWEYDVEARILDHPGSQSGRIEVERHTLTSGVIRELPGIHSTELDGGPCGSDARLELHLQAREIDWVFSDVGNHKTTISVACPGPGAEALEISREVAVRVEEKPLVLGGAATLVLMVRITASCSE